MNNTRSILFYDGVCGLCNGAVQLILKFDHRRTMNFASLSGNTARNILARHGVLRSVDSLVLITSVGTAEEKVYIKSSAVLAIAAYLGGPWNFFRIGTIVPTILRDRLYDIIARHRYRLFGQYESCPLPSLETQSRFME